jgi:transcriptional regulator NrdR family protein
MVKVVVKKDGSEEPFDVAKLKQSIRVNALDAVLRQSEKDINSLVESVSEKALLSMQTSDKVKSSEIREHVLSELKEASPTVAKIWQEYDEQAGKV